MSKTNFEHHKDEIMKAALVNKRCDFVKKHVLKAARCNDVGCEECKKKTLDWLDKPYQESKVEIDWERVPVDTPVFVGSKLNDDGTLKIKRLRCFNKKTEDGFNCFDSGYSSKDYSSTCSWKYCELAHQADVEKYKVQ